MASLTEFRKELTALLNRHSIENGSNTLDFILAEYFMDCLEAFDRAVNVRHTWYGGAPRNTEVGVEVYVLVNYGYEWHNVIGVYATPELAKEAAKRSTPAVEWEESVGGVRVPNAHGGGTHIDDEFKIWDFEVEGG